MSFDGWEFRQRHIITSGTTLTNYQVKLTIYKTSGTSSGESVYLNNRCNDNFSDIRFSVDGINALSYWIESYTSGVSATVWVKVPSISTTTIMVYYGNASAVDASSGSNTFVFFDDFSTDLSKWTKTGGGTAVVSGGKATISTNVVGYTRLYSTTQFSDNVVIETKMQSNAAGNNSARYGFFGANNATTFTTYIGYTLAVNGAVSRYINNIEGVLSVLNSSPSWVANTDTILTLKRHSTSEWQQDRANTQTLATNYPTGNLSIIYEVYSYNSIYYSTIIADWVFVRQYAATLPTHSTWYSEEYVGNTFIVTTTPSSGTIPFTTTIYSQVPGILTNFELIFGDGSTYASSSQTAFSTTHTYTKFGTYTICAQGYNGSLELSAYASVIASSNTLSTNFTYTSATNVLFSKTITSDTNITPYKSIRSVIPASNLASNGNDEIRLKINTSSAISFYNIAIVERNGSTGNGTTIPTLLTINGEYSGTLGASTNTYTDYITYHIDKTKDYLFIIDQATSAVTKTAPYYTGTSYKSTTAYSCESQNIDTPTIGDALFIVSIETNHTENTIKFTDTTTGTPNEWFWNFGDGDYSTDQNPTHIYNTPGTYTVAFYSSNQQYNGLSSQSVTIANPTPYVLALNILPYDDYAVPALFEFNATTTVNHSLRETITQFLWEINSIVISTNEFPKHYFITHGDYIVGVTITNNYGVTYTTSTLLTLGALPIANFKPSYFNVVSPTLPYNIAFTNLSYPTDIPSTTYLWDFGDSETSSSYNPTHPYDTIGSYDVSLTVTNPYGSDTITYVDAIRMTRKGRTMTEVVGGTDTFSSFGIEIFTENSHATDLSIVYATILPESFSIVQREILDNPGVDEYGILNIYRTINVIGSRIWSAINEWGHKILKLPTYTDQTGFVIYDAKIFEETVFVDDDHEFDRNP